MSEINPNTPVTEASPVNAQGGDNVTTFDELESVMSQKPEKKSKASKEADEAEAAEKATKKEPRKDLISDEKVKADKANAKSKDDGKKAAKPKVDGEAEEVDPAAVEPARKRAKGKFGQEEYDLDEDAEFTVRINGEDVPVKFKDLTSNYTGKTVWQKKFDELNHDKQTFGQDKNRFDGQKAQIKAMLEEADPTNRLIKMAQLAGVDPVQFRKNFMADMAKEFEAYGQMSDDQRKNLDLEFENRLHKQAAAESSKTLADQRAHAELETHIRGLCQKSGLGLDSFVSQFEALATQVTPEQAKAFEAEGRYKQGKPTPEFIVETIQKGNLWDSIHKALEGVELGWDGQKKTREVLQLVDQAYVNGIKPEDMADVVSELWGTARAKKVVEKKTQERQEHFEGKREVRTPAGTKSSSPVFFDEL